MKMTLRNHTANWPQSICQSYTNLIDQDVCNTLPHTFDAARQNRHTNCSVCVTHLKSSTPPARTSYAVKGYKIAQGSQMPQRLQHTAPQNVTNTDPLSSAAWLGTVDVA